MNFTRKDGDRMKKVFLLFVVICAIFAAGYYSVSSKADNQTVPTSTAFLFATQTPVNYCMVQTGIDTGRVNLRVCPGTNCGVKEVLTEGARLTILTAGTWTNVTTEDGVTGWLNSKYCKGK